MNKENNKLSPYKSIIRTTLPGYNKFLMYSHLFKYSFKKSDDFIKKAEFAAFSGDFDRAKNNLSEALDKQPENKMLWLKYAKVCYENNDIEDLERALAQYATLNTCNFENNTTSEDYTVILDLIGLNTSMGYLAEYLLESELATTVIILGHEEYLSNSLLERGRCIVVDQNDFYNPDMLQNELKSINAIERETELRNIWHWVSSDRRLFTTSKKARYFNANTPYTHTELELIIRILYTNIQSFINKYSPDLIVHFSPFYAYQLILMEIAKSQEIKVAFLSSTQIKNYVAFTPSPFEQFVYAWKSRKNNIDDSSMREAKEYVNKHLDGKRKPSDAAQLTEETHKTGRAIITWKDIINTYFSVLYLWLKNRVSNRNLSYPLDTTMESPQNMLHRAIEQTRSKIRSNPESNYTTDEITGERVVLFPLHSEPETAVSLFAPHLPPQDATADLIARSLPFDCKLYIKDHPRMTGIRDKSYYKMISNRNPNVTFLPSDKDALLYLEEVDVVITTASTVGLEALMIGKPVILLGPCHYQGIYGTIPTRNLTELPQKIQKAFSTEWNKDKLRADVTQYISSCMYEGYQLGIFSDLRTDYDYTSGEFQGFCEWFCNKVDRIKSDPDWEKPASYGYAIPHPDRSIK